MKKKVQQLKKEEKQVKMKKKYLKKYFITIPFLKMKHLMFFNNFKRKAQIGI